MANEICRWNAREMAVPRGPRVADMNRGRITVCFRFDDPSAVSEHDLESDVLDLLAGFGARTTVAVVPFAGKGKGVPPVCAEQVPHLVSHLQAGDIEIALHGHNHARVSADERGTPSEFCGRSLAEQRRLLQEGKRHLETVFETAVTGLVPPWNTHDRATLEAAAAEGFAYLSVGQVNAHGAQYDQLSLIPKTCALREREALSVLAKAVKVRQYGPIVVFVMHAYNFQESKEPRGVDEAPPFLSLPMLESVLEHITALGEEVEFATLAEVARRFRKAGGYWNPESLRTVGRWSYRLAQRLPAGYLLPFPRRNAMAAVGRTLWL